MRLIDADKIVYMWQQDRNGKFRDGVTLESIVNDMPTVNANDLIIKELEKLKAEFEENKYILLNQITAIKVINKYIAELKGEDNERRDC